jgi:hypothetical protein
LIYDKILTTPSRKYKKKSDRLYDHSAWRFIDQQFTHLFDKDQEFPKRKYGQITTAPWNIPTRAMQLNYCVEFISTGYASVDLEFLDPVTEEERKQRIYAESGYWFKKKVEFSLHIQR